MKINLFNINNIYMYYILVIKLRFKDFLIVVAIFWIIVSYVNGRFNYLRNVYFVIFYFELL